MSTTARAARAVARANIALAKYWGKADEALNLPAVPSVSITLSPLTTRTTVRFVDGLSHDRFLLGGQPAEPKETARVSKLLDTVRAAAQLSLHAEVESANDFPGSHRARRASARWRRRRARRRACPSIAARSARCRVRLRCPPRARRSRVTSSCRSASAAIPR
jgi:diphosphomevalonate decarboxylase